MSAQDHLELDLWAGYMRCLREAGGVGREGQSPGEHLLGLDGIWRQRRNARSAALFAKQQGKNYGYVCAVSTLHIRQAWWGPGEAGRACRGTNTHHPRP